MDDFGGLLPNLQIGPVWLVLIGVGIGLFVAGRFPNLLGWLPSVFKPQPDLAELVRKAVEAAMAKQDSAPAEK